MMDIALVELGGKWTERMLWDQFDVHNLGSMTRVVEYVDSVSSAYYIGATSFLRRRWEDLGHNDKWHFCWVLGFSTMDHIKYLEIALISQFKPRAKCTNIRGGGDGLGKAAEFGFVHICSKPLLVSMT